MIATISTQQRVGIAAASALAFGLLTAYCQIRSGFSVPLESSLRGAAITLGSWTLFGTAIWIWRDKVLDRVRQAQAGNLVATVGLVFAAAIAVALLSCLLSTALGGRELPAEFFVRHLVRLTPMLLLVAVAVTAVLAALHWRWELAGRDHPVRPIEVPTSVVPQWIELPEAPLLRLRRDEIAVIRTARNYCEMEMAGRTILVRITAKRLEERLAPLGFARVHRTTIVNLGRVKMMHPDRSGRLSLLLDDGSRLPVSRAYRDGVRRRMTGH